MFKKNKNRVRIFLQDTVYGGNTVGFVNLHKYMVLKTSKSLVQIAPKPRVSISNMSQHSQKLKKRWCSRQFFEKLTLNIKLNLLQVQNGLRYRCLST
jgi:hypothetical protein